MTTLAPTLTTRLLPAVDQKIRDLLLISAGALLVALLAQVRIPLPFTPVPLTGQTFAVLLVGAAHGAGWPRSRSTALSAHWVCPFSQAEPRARPMPSAQPAATCSDSWSQPT